MKKWERKKCKVVTKDQFNQCLQTISDYIGELGEELEEEELKDSVREIIIGMTLLFAGVKGGEVVEHLCFCNEGADGDFSFSVLAIEDIIATINIAKETQYFSTSCKFVPTHPIELELRYELVL